jgi:Heterokaryon incompatibility protein (HET)
MSTQTDATIHATSLAHQLDGLTLSSRSKSWTNLPSDNSIRLLQLQPTVANEDPLHCTLVEIQLTEPSRTFEVVEEPDNISVGNEDSDGEWEDVEESSHLSPPLEEPTQLFEVISYACGASNPSVPLYIDHDAHALITPHLAAALRCLQYDNRDRFLWVDTVCIYSDRSRIKHCRNLRFEPLFSGFAYLAGRIRTHELL